MTCIQRYTERWCSGGRMNRCEDWSWILQDCKEVNQLAICWPSEASRTNITYSNTPQCKGQNLVRRKWLTALLSTGTCRLEAFARQRGGRFPPPSASLATSSALLQLVNYSINVVP